MKFALSLPNAGPASRLVDIAVSAEANGWDAVFLWDHIHLFREMRLDLHDPWVLLGAIASRTTRIRIGTMVTPLPRRRPQKYANEVVTLDHLSGGRVTCGVGLGLPGATVEEYAAAGVTWLVESRWPDELWLDELEDSATRDPRAAT